MNVQAVCFDLFNTLVSVGRVPDTVGRYTADVLGVDREVWNRVCFSMEHDITGVTRHIDVIRSLARAVDPDIPERKIAEATEHRQRRFDHALLEVESEVMEGLQRLHASGVALALVSNASTAEVAAWSASPLRRFFHSVVFSCECGYRKPEQGIYARALRELGSRAEATLFVGDGGSDEHIGAQRAGMRPYLLTHFIATHRQTSHEERHSGIVEATLGRFSDLVERILELNAEG